MIEALKVGLLADIRVQAVSVGMGSDLMGRERVEDIAAASHVTARALQLAFRRHLDTTPMAYVRRVRLQRLHQELRHADPADGATVTAAAARWGFQQMGRLSAQYRDLFGESPRDTLRRP